MRSGSGGSTSDSSVNTCARLRLARSFTYSSTNTCSCVSSSMLNSRCPSQTGRPTAVSSPHHLEDPIAVDAHARVLLDDRHQRARRLEAHFEPLIVEAENRAVGGALRDAGREHARQAPPHREVLIGIDQRVDELADALFGDAAQRVGGVSRDRIPGEQRNHVRNHHRREAALGAQHALHPLAITRSQRARIWRTSASRLAEHACRRRRPARRVLGLRRAFAAISRHVDFAGI